MKIKTKKPAAAVCIAVVCILLAHQTAAAQMGRPRAVAKERLRATPPGPTWDKASQASFFDDAFLTLTGDRPDFGSVSAPKLAADSPPSESTPSGGFRWSSLVSPDTLVDEIKDTKGLLAAAVASPSDFKGGGYDKAREGFSSIALAFGVIAAHDGDVRWKKDAVTARDLFARVGFNCKVGTDQSFSESRARLADLETLLDGSPLKTQAEREEDEDFLWSQVAARPALMSRLEVADEFLGGAIASKADFTKQVEKVLHDIEMVAVISEVIQQNNFEYHDDDAYRAHSAAMRAAAVKAREGATKGDYDGVRAAVGAIKKSCDSCHDDYRFR